MVMDQVEDWQLPDKASYIGPQRSLNQNLSTQPSQWIDFVKDVVQNQQALKTEDSEEYFEGEEAATVMHIKINDPNYNSTLSVIIF